MKTHSLWRERSGTRLVGLAAAVTTVAGVLATLPITPAAAAGPTNVSRSGTIVSITAGPGTANDISVFLDENNEITVIDDAGIVDIPGDGCTVFFGDTARCGTGATLVSALLGDGDDEIQLEFPIALVVNGESGNDTFLGGMARGGASRTTFRGGTGIDTASYVNADRFVTVSLDDRAFDGRPGDTDDIRADVENVVGSRFPDTLTGSAVNNTLDGRTGPDIVRGLAGDDTFPEGEFASGADDFSGGEGRDSVSYSQRRAGITVDLDNVADDGAVGEGDNVRGDVELVATGLGDDVVLGNAAANEFSSSAGTDRFEGRGGPDVLTAEDGAAGNRGTDTLLGGGGNDRVSVADEVLDNVRCGVGTGDRVFIDAGIDTILGCELVGTN
jgi:Ca2+-binding RTX toxin-like protein